MSQREPFSDTELCVKCGLCLPHCPTYNKTLDENESPRGRLALIQAWASGLLPADARLLTHLDNCLLCRACERICPALVPYGRLMDQFRTETGGGRRAASVTALKALVEDRKRLALAGSALKKYRRSGMQTFVRSLGLARLLGLGSLEKLLPQKGEPKQAWLPRHRPAAEARGRVGLFVGCMGRLVDAETIDAAISVLTRVGFEVSLPVAQGCCGALHFHDGDAETARRLARENLAAFEGRLDAIVTLASGCGSMLKEYSLHDNAAAEFSKKIQDISQFLAETEWPSNIEIAPLDARVCLHTPCSLKNVLRQAGGPETLLKKIPGIDLVKLPETTHCCGAAGSYMLEHPAMAESLREDVLTQVEALSPDYLASSNIGCIIHLADGLRETIPEAETLHPVALLARQINAAEKTRFK